MLIRAIAATVNGALVLVLYIAAWGVPSSDVGLLEVGLAVAAGLSTWYALKKLEGTVIRLPARRRGGLAV